MDIFNEYQEELENSFFNLPRLAFLQLCIRQLLLEQQ